MSATGRRVASAAFNRLQRLIQRGMSAVMDRRHRTWVRQAFANVAPIRGTQQQMESAIAYHTRSLRSAYDRWRVNPAEGAALVDLLLTVCVHVEATAWHRGTRLRSYVDVSVQLATLRALVDRLVQTHGASAGELVQLILARRPDARAAWLLQTELRLEQDDVDGAIESVEHALRMQAVCPTAQALLYRAYQQKRAAGSTDPRFAMADYDLSDKFCAVPFQSLSTGWQGSAHLCCCPAWVPFPVGNLLTAESSEAVWNSPEAIEVRRSILDGDFSYCSRTLCSMITGRRLPIRSAVPPAVYRRYIEPRATVMPEGPLAVDLNYDTTCNLACPSCRTDITGVDEQTHQQYTRAASRVILPLLKQTHGRLYVSGGGEVLASRHGRALLAALNPREFPGLSVYLITNGQLLNPRRWEEFPDLASMVGMLGVSVDAATAETYEVLRRPGKWAPLMDNLEFCAQLRRAQILKGLTLNFVVQQQNFREMRDFVALGTRLGADRIWFQRVTNYGAYDDATFRQVDVTSPTHPDHAELLEILCDPMLARAGVNIEMLRGLVPEGMAASAPIPLLSEPYLFGVPGGPDSGPAKVGPLSSFG